MQPRSNFLNNPWCFFGNLNKKNKQKAIGRNDKLQKNSNHVLEA